MILWGIVLLVIGIVIWVVARTTGPPALLVVGQAVGLIGLLVLVVGLVLLALDPATVTVPTQ